MFIKFDNGEESSQLTDTEYLPPSSSHFGALYFCRSGILFILMFVQGRKVFIITNPGENFTQSRSIFVIHVTTLAVLQIYVFLFPGQYIQCLRILKISKMLVHYIGI